MADDSLIAHTGEHNNELSSCVLGRKENRF